MSAALAMAAQYDLAPVRYGPLDMYWKWLMLNLAPTTDGKTYLQRTWEHIDINHVGAFQKCTSVINTSQCEIVDSVEF